ncbi:MAG: hypothetical protein WAV84_11425, partial [Bacteroidota bacterium]
MKTYATFRSTLLLSAFALTLLLALSACQHNEDKPVTTLADSAAVEAEAAPMQPDDERGVDIGRWGDMTRSDFDNLYTTFTQTEPPIVRNYGICDSITCHFPSTASDARPEILICDLNGVYLVTEAFQLLGIEIGQVGGTEGAWINVKSLDKRFSALQYKNT